MGLCQEEEGEPSDVIVLSSDSIHAGNYFAMGSSVEISGVVQGDLYLLASQIFIDGEVIGDVLVAGGSVEISGNVHGNVRIIGGQVTISGTVGRNATIVAGNTTLIPTAKIKGSLVCTAGNADLGSSIGEGVTIVASNLRISNYIGGNVHAYVGKMRLSSKAHIEGNVEYSSDEPARIEPQAIIGGEITHKAPFLHNAMKGGWLKHLKIGSKIATILMNFLYTFFIGWFSMRIFPHKLNASLEALRHHPWKALSYGVALLILFPIVSLILLMTVLGAPFALTVLALNIVSFYTAKVFTIMWAATSGLRKIGLHMRRSYSFFLCLVLYFILIEIPVIGIFVSLAAMLFGLGAGALSALKKA